RKADSPEKEISIKRRRVDPTSLYHRPAPATGRFHFSLPSKRNSCTTQTSQLPDPAPSEYSAPTPAPSEYSAPTPAPTPSTAPATGCFDFFIPGKHNSCTTQASQLKPAPARRPGRPRDLTLNRKLFKEVVEELRQEYQGAVLSNEVPTQSSLLVEEYLDNLWATARLVTKRDRRKVVTKHDIKSALYNRADIIL
ncbi:hypothetical protein CEXT_572461, partial [Caerostris extrusa]